MVFNSNIIYRSYFQDNISKSSYHDRPTLYPEVESTTLEKKNPFDFYESGIHYRSVVLDYMTF